MQSRDHIDASAPETSDPYIGKSLSDYKITRELGRGGMGAVYEAVHEKIGQHAAIKVLSQELSDDTEYVNRFTGEARAASRVTHPGLVKIFGFGTTPEGAPYILMELLRGESLQQKQERFLRNETRVPKSEAVRHVAEIADALAAVHAQGITHRDLKPGNIMLVASEGDAAGREPRCKIVDFGIAKESQSGPADSAARQTTEGRFLGTAIYASPEQCRTEGNVGPAADVYSMGVILYELLAGQPPFVGATGVVMGMHIFQKPRPLRSLCPDLPDALHSLVHRMLEKEPAKRPSMAEVAASLSSLDVTAPARRTRLQQVMLAGSVAIACMAIPLVVMRGRGTPAKPVPVPASEAPNVASPQPSAPAASVSTAPVVGPQPAATEKAGASGSAPAADKPPTGPMAPSTAATPAYPAAAASPGAPRATPKPGSATGRSRERTVRADKAQTTAGPAGSAPPDKPAPAVVPPPAAAAPVKESTPASPPTEGSTHGTDSKPAPTADKPRRKHDAVY